LAACVELIVPDDPGTARVNYEFARALRFAHALRAGLACQVEGAWLVELAPVRDPDGVPAALAAVFGVSVRFGMTLEESLAEFLRTKQLLVLLDNCEHLLEPVAELVEFLVHSCAGLVVLATSREGLAADGERILPVPSLPSPSPDAGPEVAGQADAVRLFVERARAVDPDFSLTADNTAAVIQICRRLDPSLARSTGFPPIPRRKLRGQRRPAKLKR
jgi:predicted ATPase